jgi:hypothetical protein
MTSGEMRKKNDVRDMPGPSTIENQHIFPTIGAKQKDKAKEPAGGVCKKTKSHREAPVYNLTNDYMDRICYQVRDVMEELMEEETGKKEEKQKRVKDQLTTLQKLLVAPRLEKEREEPREDHPVSQGRDQRVHIQS